jgi:carbon storage regulator CsrA
VSVLAVEGERVKIGIDAPANVTILREELLKILSPEVVGEEETAPSLD